MLIKKKKIANYVDENEKLRKKLENINYKLELIENENKELILTKEKIKNDYENKLNEESIIIRNLKENNLKEINILKNEIKENEDKITNIKKECDDKDKKFNKIII